MSQAPDTPHGWDDPDEDPQRALQDMRRGIARAQEQARTFRKALHPDEDAEG